MKLQRVFMQIPIALIPNQKGNVLEGTDDFYQESFEENNDVS